MMKTLGKKFKSLRQKKGCNQQTMAELLGISIPAYSKLETNITDPNFSRICQIAALHDMDVIQLLSYGEERGNNQQLETDALRKKVADLEGAIIRLQTKVINLYDREDQRLKGLEKLND